MTHPILIAGAGPGGLCAALALEHAGREVQLLERTDALRTAGAGLILAVNARRVLAGIGIDQALVDAGCVLREGRVETADGRRLQDLALDRLDDQFGFTNIGVHRGTLARLLAQRLQTPIQFNANVADVKPSDDYVDVTLADGRVLRGSALIGADGIHSAVRTCLHGPTPLRYSGMTCWRGLAAVPSPLGPGVFVEKWGAGPRFGIVPVGDRLTYWFATANEPRDGVDGPEVRAELCERFASFGVDHLIRSSEAIQRNDLVDIAPLPSWTVDRCSLLGDAAHAMTPNLGQGANQAIEDGGALARALSEHGIQAGLQVYEAARRPRTTQIVQRSWRFGQVATLENPLATALRDLVMRMTPQSVVERGVHELYAG